MPEIDARQLAEWLDEGVVLVDADGLITFTNAAAQTALDLPSDTTGMAADQVIRDFRVTRLIEVARAGGGVQRKEFEDARGGRHLIATAASMGASTIVIIRDDTHLRRLERVRQDFVANVSHELRTPVTAIRLIVETLLNGALEDAVAAREFVSRIDLESAHLTQMVEELLDLSRMEAGLDVLDRRPVAVADVLATLSRLQPLLDRHEQRLRIDAGDGIPMIEGDKRRLEQVFRNLVHNAIKFSPDNAAIDVVVRAPTAASVEIQVIDSGVGIADSEMPRVFERFWKSDRSRQRDGVGTGLGLAIVRHIIEAHGGTVAVTSSPRHGSTFTMTLPAITAAQPAPA